MIINLFVLAYTSFGLFIILFKKNPINNAIIILTIGLIIGYRTFEPIMGFKLHPVEVLLYATVIRIIVSRLKPVSHLPKIILFLGLVFPLFFIVDSVTGYKPSVLVNFKNAFILIVVFFVIRYTIVDNKILTKFCTAYLVSSTLIATIGIMEFNFPDFVSSIFGFDPNNNYRDTGSILFSRLAFLYWGSHLAGNLIPPVFPILIFLKSKNHFIVQNNILLIIFTLLNLFAVYLSGNRISWLMLTIFLLATLIYFKSSIIPHLKTYTLLITSAFVIYVYSQPVEGRYLSTFKALTGNIDKEYDSSGQSRIERALTAINSITNNPIGSGWGSQGWVHSDVLQLAADLGVITGFLFFISPVLLLIRFYKLYSSVLNHYKTRFFLCMLLLIYVIVSFSLNGNILKVQTGMPLFLIWAICWAFLENVSYKNQKIIH